MREDLKSIVEGRRISAEEGAEILRTADWLEIAQAAWEVRVARHGADTASYTMFRVVNYTNICNVDCKFCSFQVKPESKFAYVLDKEAVFTKVEESLAQGADQMFFQGGVHPDLPLDYYTDILSAVKARYGIHIRAFSPVEVLGLSKVSGRPLGEVLDKLKDAGVDSIPGAGAELLVERMRELLTPLKCTTQQWCDIMAECHEHGLKGSATMVVGAGETLEETVAHLEAVRGIQDKTGGFHSFIPWVYQQQTKRFKVHKLRPDEFMKIMAFSRLYLDNIDNIEISVLVLGKDLGKIALRMGANDISSAVIEENVLKSFGLRSEKEAVKYIEEAGFRAVRRNFNYEPMEPMSVVWPKPESVDVSAVAS